MIDKIKGLLKRNDSSIEAPKELPNLLYEENSEEINSQSKENINSVDSQQTSVQNQQPVREEPVKEEIQKTQHIQETQQTKFEQEVPAQEPSKPQFVDETLGELNEEVSEEVTLKTQGEARPQPQSSPIIQKKEFDIAQLEPKIPIEPEPQKVKKPEIPRVAEQKIERLKETEQMPVQMSVQQEADGILKQNNKDIEEFKKRIFIRSENNFFKSVEDAIKNASDTSKIQELMEQDLFKSMKIHHRNEEEHNNLNLKLNSIEEEVREKLMHLKVLEDEWLMEKKNLEIQEKMFLEKEEEVFQGIEELKSLFSKLNLNKKLNQQVSEENHFILFGGQRINSFSSLISNLKMMDEYTFNHHVNEERNDFASWIEHVYDLKDIAKEIRETKSRQDIISILEGV